jgi:outer membrane lipase/esterase
MLRRRGFARSLFAILFFVGATGTASAQFSQVFFFGDSLTDPGNVAGVIGSDPTQVITGNTYIPSRPYASNQFTNGDVWAKTFASALGVPLSAQPVPLGGGNYAFGGARVAVDGGGGFPPSLQSQENLYLNSTGHHAPSSALYVIAGGGNDARDTLISAGMSMNPVAVIGAAAMSFAQSIGVMVDQLQAAGAQHIVVWDVPDLGLAPAVTALGAGPTFLGTQVSLAMNNALATRLTGEAGVSIFDLYGLQNQIVANPASFGLLNVTDACGAPTAQCDPATALYWDGIHPTATGHALLAQGMLAVVAVPEPSELALMLSGLVVVVAWQRRARRASRR